MAIAISHDLTFIFTLSRSEMRSAEASSFACHPPKESERIDERFVLEIFN